MQECRFEQAGDGRIACKVCGTAREHAGDPRDYHRRCGPSAQPYTGPWPPKPDPRFFTPCAHRGAALELGVCNVCGQHGQPFEIFACAIHEKCMERRSRNDRPDLTVCFNCDDFLPLELPSASRP
jgi:hypothetical protein